VVVAEERSAEHHRQRTEGGNAGRDVGFLVESNAQLDEMQYAVAIQGKFNQPEKRLPELHHAIQTKVRLG